MSVTGPGPLQSFEAEIIYGRMFFNLQKIIHADLTLDESDKRVDRAVMGAVFAQRVLLEAYPLYSFRCSTEDFLEWKNQYLEWFDANSKRTRLKKSERDTMRATAVEEFDRTIALSQPNARCFRDM
jgi:hypothetical protein